MTDLIVIGGGLAGSEAAWQAAQQGLDVRLYEMRPGIKTGAHRTSELAELVCSNSLGSNLSNRASGILMSELRALSSLLLEIAEDCALPAGSALAVDRDLFASRVTERIANHPKITLIREEIQEIPESPVIIASGPLTSQALADSIRQLSGEANLFFFDAISPIVSNEGINMNIAFRASRYQRGDQSDGDYINCPFSKPDYYTFVKELVTAERIPLRNMEMEITNGVKAGHYFEGCLPVEVIAERGPETLAFGPMRPVGLTNPRTGSRPYAVVQLRQDNLARSMYNLVGFQTNLKYHEQKRVFSMIPGLETAQFIRYGQMHRNTFIASPRVLQPTLQYRQREDIFFAGQITGVEGYLGNIATGLLSGLNATRLIKNQPLLTLPPETMLGALCHYISNADLKDFQPMKSNFGILPPLEEGPLGKSKRATAYASRAGMSLESYLSNFS